MCSVACGSQESMVDSLELVIHATLNQHIYVLGTKPMSPARAVIDTIDGTLNLSRPIFLSNICEIKNN